LNYAEKIKDLEQQLAEKQKEKEQIKSDFRTRKILSGEAAKLLSKVNDKIADIEKELKQAQKRQEGIKVNDKKTHKSLKAQGNEPAMKVYEDYRGWRYKIMQGLGESTYKARYHKPDSPKNSNWRCVTILPWRKTEAEAQKDLDEWAKKKGMKEVKA